VEKLSQMEVLYNLGCHICQGFLYARPMSPADVERWLQETQQGQTLPRLGNLTNEPSTRLVSVPR
jgi:sensor c-di-GMP phosphodiesterase-like protein